MNSNQESRLSTTGKIRTLFGDKSKIWEDNKLISESVEQIDDFLTDIGNTFKLQETPISGFTRKKEKFRNLVNITTDIFYRMFCALGTNIGDPEIYDRYKMSLSGIKKVLDNKLQYVIKDAQEFAEENKDALKDYGLSDKLLEKYGKEADGYISYSNKPAEGKAIRSAATKRLVVIFSELSTFFKKKLDNEMIQYKLTQPVFYSEYKEARNIFDNPTHKRSLYGRILGEKTKQPIVDATVTAKFKTDADLANTVKMTSNKGNYTFPKLKPGIWIITFEKFGYDTITIEIEIFKGKGYRRDVKLRKTE